MGDTWRMTAALWWDVWRAGRETPAGLVARQRRRLADLVRFARTCSPYYRALYASLPAQVEDPDALPVVRKAELMAHFDEWVTDPAVTRAGAEAFIADTTRVGAPFLGRYFLCRTSGTSGTPGLFLHDDRSLRVVYALMALRVEPCWMTPMMMRQMAGMGWRTASLLAVGNHFLGYGQYERLGQLHPRLRPYLTRNRLYPVTTPLDELVPALNAWQPGRLAGYTNALVLLAEEQRAGRLHLAPVIVATSGESICPEARERLRAAFRCQVRDSYACSETIVTAFECAQGWLHVNSDWLLLEPVDAEYRPVPVGQPSRTVLLTNLANRVQPLIRYDLGDSITVRPEPCPCGLVLPAIRVEGRTDEILTLRGPGGTTVRVMPLALATEMEKIAGVRRYQCVQVGPATLQVRLESEPGTERVQVWERTERALGAYLARQGAAWVALELDPDLPRRNVVSGKFRHVWAESPAIVPVG